MDTTTAGLAGLALGGLLGAGWGLWRGARVARREAQREAEVVTRERDAAAQVAAAEATSRERALQAELAAAQAQVQAERDAAARAASAAKATFADVATDALAANAATFGRQLEQLAKAAAATQQATADKALQARQHAVSELVSPLREALGQLQKSHAELERNRADAYGALRRDLEALHKRTERLDQSTTALGTALRGSSATRGDWGQVSLRNVVELAGMTRHCDFTEEVTLSSGAGGRRVDLLVRLPGGGGVPVDAKVPMAAWWRAHEAESEADRDLAMAAHAKATRVHVDALAGRDYADLVDGPVDFTVMYLPSDALLGAALGADPTLQDDAMRRGVLLASPMTLLALLRTVAVYWRQQRLADDARRIVEQAREVHGRVAVFTGHLAKVGQSLERVNSAWDKAVGSYERRVEPAGRKLTELLGADKALAPLAEVGRAPRRIAAAPGSPPPGLDPSPGGASPADQ